MARRSRLAGRFDRECGWAARSLCQAYSCACRQIQLAPKIRLQISFPAKKSPVPRLIFSYSCSFFCAPAFWIFIRTETEPQLTHCNSVRGMLRRNILERQAESSSERQRNLFNLHEKGNGTVTRHSPFQRSGFGRGAGVGRGHAVGLRVGIAVGVRNRHYRNSENQTAIFFGG